MLKLSVTYNQKEQGTGEVFPVPSLPKYVQSSNRIPIRDLYD
jgi:hypothetical protein